MASNHVFVLLLMYGCFAVTGGVSCPTLQYLELGQPGVIECYSDDTYYAVYWYQSWESYITDDSFAHYSGGDRGGISIESGKFNISEDGSLVVRRVEVEDEGCYTVVYRKEQGQEDIVTNVTVSVAVSPDQDMPIIAECNTNRTCRLEPPRLGSLTCVVLDIRPAIELEWSIVDGSESAINITSLPTSVMPNDYTLDISRTVEYSVHESFNGNLTLRCRSRDGHIRDLSRDVTIVFTTDEEVVAQPNPKGSKTALLVLLIPAAIVAAYLIYRQRKRRRKKKSPETDTTKKELTAEEGRGKTDKSPEGSAGENEPLMTMKGVQVTKGEGEIIDDDTKTGVNNGDEGSPNKENNGPKFKSDGGETETVGDDEADGGDVDEEQLEPKQGPDNDEHVPSLAEDVSTADIQFDDLPQTAALTSPQKNRVKPAGNRRPPTRARATPTDTGVTENLLSEANGIEAGSETEQGQPSLKI